MSAAMLPDAAAWRTFTYRILNAAGVGSLGAGVTSAAPGTATGPR